MATWASIFEHPGMDPHAHRIVLDQGGQRTILVPVSDPSIAVTLVEDLIAEGVGLIELCGGFALTDAAAVASAVAGRVPVGHVTYSIDALEPAHRYAQEAARERRL